MLRNLGPIAFFLGIVISILVGFINIGEAGVLSLLILGIIVGILNIQPTEELKYLIAIVALLFSSSELNRFFMLLPGGVGPILGNILQALIVFLASGAAIVSLKVLIELARD